MDRCSAPFFRALDALAVDDCRRRAGLAASVLTAEDVQRMVDAVERPIIVPAAEIVVHRAPRCQVRGQRAPLTAGREDIHPPVHHCPHIDLPLVAAALGGRDQRADDRPFFVGQIARIPQLAPVIPSPILLGPHDGRLSYASSPRLITTDSSDSLCSRTDTKSSWRPSFATRRNPNPATEATLPPIRWRICR